MQFPLCESIPWKNGPEFYHRLVSSETKDSFCLYSGGETMLSQGTNVSSSNRFSYVGIRPLYTLKVYSDHLEKVDAHGKCVYSHEPLCFVKEVKCSFDLRPYPFWASGWLIGLHYEFAAWVDPIFLSSLKGVQRYLGFFALYDPILVFDHQESKAWVSSWGLNQNAQTSEWVAKKRLESTVHELASQISVFEKNDLRVNHSHLRSDSTVNLKDQSLFGSLHFVHDSSEGYESKVQSIFQHLLNGDCYQMNLSQEFRAKLPSSFSSEQATDLFWYLAKRHPAPFSACFYDQEEWVLSLSPEQFFKLEGKRVSTAPIKGSKKRGKTPEQDRSLILELSQSEKEKSELLMITDLVRNDLGKVSELGTVRVLEFGKLQTLDYVHHLYSEIQSELAQGFGFLDLLFALFPGGSVTGAPKIKAVELISKYESHPRSIYTGTIGFLDHSPFAHCSIAIRTLRITEEEIIFCMGGGVVIDSDPKSEYEETLVKAQVFGRH